MRSPGQPRRILIMGVFVFLAGLIAWIILKQPQKEGIVYFGGGEGVSGTLAVINSTEGRVLLDCGSFYPELGSSPEERVRNAETANQGIPTEAASADVLVVTHAHADHIGRIPLLIRSGFKGDIYATAPTIALSEVMLKMLVRWDGGERRKWVWSSSKGRPYITTHGINDSKASDDDESVAKECDQCPITILTTSKKVTASFSSKQPFHSMLSPSSKTGT